MVSERKAASASRLKPLSSSRRKGKPGKLESAAAQARTAGTSGRRRQWIYTLPYAVAVQEGRVGYGKPFWVDPERGSKFSTYAYPAIMRSVWGAVKGEIRRIRQEIPTEVLGLYFYENSPDPARLRDWEDVRQCLSALVKRLPKKQAQIIQMHYGLDGYVPHSQPEIANAVWGHQAAHQSIGNSCAGVAATACPQPGVRSLLARHDQAQYELADRLAQEWLRRRGGRSGRH